MEFFSNLTPAEVDWFYNHLISAKGVQPSVGVSGSKDRKELVHRWLDWNREQHVTSYKVEEQRIFDTMKREAIRDEDINWLDAKNRLQCLHTWGAVRSLNFFNRNGYPIYDVSDAEIPSQYQIIPGNLNSTPIFDNLVGRTFETESSKIIMSVVDFFHRLRGTREHKVLLLNDLKAMSSQLAYIGSPVYALANSDGETRRWLWNYLMSKGVPTNYLTANEFEIEPEHLIVAFDLWAVSDAEKELLMHRLKAAYSQRKTRLKRQNRKAYQIYLTPRHKDMLNELAWNYDRKIYEVVEHLISNSFEEMKKR